MAGIPGRNVAVGAAAGGSRASLPHSGPYKRLVAGSEHLFGRRVVQDAAEVARPGVGQGKSSRATGGLGAVA